jgi:hypothetical protein
MIVLEKVKLINNQYLKGKVMIVQKKKDLMFLIVLI